MGLFDKVKGFLNVGGVSVKITKLENPFPAGDTAMNGEFRLTTDSDRTVLSTSARFYKKRTYKGDDGQDKSEVEALGNWSSKDYLLNDEYPFELAKGESKDISFLMLNIHCPPSLAASSGVVGAIGKMAAFASKLGGERIEFFVEVTADVKGTPFDPSDTMQIQIVEKPA